MEDSAKSYLKTLFDIAVQEAQPSVCMPKHLVNIDASQGLCVLGAGKAAVQMAEVIDHYFDKRCSGTIVTRYGYTDKSNIGSIKVLKANHPIPDKGSMEAAIEILKLAKNNSPNIPVVFLISGGGSALLSLPVKGLELEKKIKINRFLLASGASIDEINIVRKQLSGIKGNKLAEVVKGSHFTLIISDVIGDDPSLIASGPTVHDQSTAEQAISILSKYQWQDMESIEKLLENPLNKGLSVAKNENIIIMANAKLSIDKAVEKAKNDGWQTKVLSYTQQGEAKIVARQHAAIALKALNKGQAIILFSGGELTVTLSEDSGSGGPNQEYLLALAIELNGIEGISVIACDTDGIDGCLDVAGAFIDNSTIERAKMMQMDAKYYLRNNKSYDFFNKLNDHILTGPTHTNVNDFRAIIINPC